MNFDRRRKARLKSSEERRRGPGLISDRRRRIGRLNAKATVATTRLMPPCLLSVLGSCWAFCCVDDPWTSILRKGNKLRDQRRVIHFETRSLPLFVT